MSTNKIESGIQSINNHLVRMALLAENQVKDSIKALVERDFELAEKIKTEDSIIDDLQRVIEDQAIKLIATQQPVASDLRTLFTTIKIVTDVERIADYAVDIARIVLMLQNNRTDRDLSEIEKMGEIASKMLQDSIDAYTSKDDDKAYEVTKLDDEVDKSFMNLIKQLYYGNKEHTQDETNEVTQLNFVGKYLERIGDHATNICEWTIYIVTGEYVELNL